MAAFAVSDPRLAAGIAARKALLLTRNVDRVVFARILGKFMLPAGLNPALAC